MNRPPAGRLGRTPDASALVDAIVSFVEFASRRLDWALPLSVSELVGIVLSSAAAAISGYLLALLFDRLFGPAVADQIYTWPDFMSWFVAGSIVLGWALVAGLVTFTPVLSLVVIRRVARGYVAYAFWVTLIGGLVGLTLNLSARSFAAAIGWGPLTSILDEGWIHILWRAVGLLVVALAFLELYVPWKGRQRLGERGWQTWRFMRVVEGLTHNLARVQLSDLQAGGTRQARTERRVERLVISIAAVPAPTTEAAAWRDAVQSYARAWSDTLLPGLDDEGLAEALERAAHARTRSEDLLGAVYGNTAPSRPEPGPRA